MRPSVSTLGLVLGVACKDGIDLRGREDGQAGLAGAEHFEDVGLAHAATRRAPGEGGEGLEVIPHLATESKEVVKWDIVADAAINGHDGVLGRSGWNTPLEERGTTCGELFRIGGGKC